MEKPTNEEQNLPEQATPVNVSELSNAQIQMGIDINMTKMTQRFVSELTILEDVVKRQIDVRVNAKMPDGRKVHIRIR